MQTRNQVRGNGRAKSAVLQGETASAKVRKVAGVSSETRSEFLRELNMMGWIPVVTKATGLLHLAADRLGEDSLDSAGQDKRKLEMLQVVMDEVGEELAEWSERLVKELATETAARRRAAAAVAGQEGSAR